jgi:hypothetical protein
MSHHGSQALEAAVGNIGIVCEQSTSVKRSKLSSVKIGSDDSYYMLAAFCFDLSRKVNYLFRAAREFAPEADPELARQLLEDNEAINADGLSWEQRARNAEAILMRTVNELSDDHVRVLLQVADKAPAKKAPTK